MNIQNVIKKIELETEKKIIEFFDTGQIIQPVLTKDNKTIKPSNNVENQTNIFKDIMNEGVNNFESSTGRKPTYSELRQMFG